MRRRVAKLALLLVFSAIVNIAVAWTFSLCTNYQWPTRVDFEPSRQAKGVAADHRVRGPGAHGWEKPGARRIVSYWPLPSPPPPQGDRKLFAVWFGKYVITGGPTAPGFVPLPRFPIPRWSRLVNEWKPDEPPWLMEDAYGWPFESFYCSFAIAGDDAFDLRATSVRGAIPVRGIYAAGAAAPPFACVSAKAIPLSILWPGFVINTLLFAGVFWVLFTAPGLIRRVARRQDGRCIACGYDLRGIDSQRCPECGAGRT